MKTIDHEACGVGTVLHDGNAGSKGYGCGEAAGGALSLCDGYGVGCMQGCGQGCQNGSGMGDGEGDGAGYTFSTGIS
jgi:hypothetical protein